MSSIKRQAIQGIGREHVGKWVALSEDQKTVVGFSDDLAELTQRIGSERSVIYTRVLDPDKAYAF